MTDHTPIAALPDDPRDCCRAACAIMIGDTFEPAMLEAGDAIEIAWAALANSGGITPTAELARMLERAGTAMQRLTAEVDQVRELVRHGTSDHRELDQRIATLASGPTAGAVDAAIATASALGKPMTEDEAVALLKARPAA